MNVSISLTLPADLLAKIQQNVAGKSRSEKIRKCVQVGYEEFTSNIVREAPILNDER